MANSKTRELGMDAGQMLIFTTSNASTSENLQCYANVDVVSAQAIYTTGAATAATWSYVRSTGVLTAAGLTGAASITFSVIQG